MKLVRYSDLKETYGIPWSRRHILRLEETGKFPRRVPMGQNSFGYRETEIEAYITGLIKARDDALALA